MFGAKSENTPFYISTIWEIIIVVAILSFWNLMEYLSIILRSIDIFNKQLSPTKRIQRIEKVFLWKLKNKLNDLLHSKHENRVGRPSRLVDHIHS